MKPTIRCVVVDSQEWSSQLITEHIQRIPVLELKELYSDYDEALSGCEDVRPDLIFLDILMPEFSATEFIESLRSSLGDNLPKLVVITESDKYALAGYDHGVQDYLLKPVSFLRFRRCIERLLPLFNVHDKENREFFFADINGKKLKINYRDILFIEAAGNYVNLTTNQGVITLYKTMNCLLNVLPDDQFIRVHKSFITSVYPIREITGNEILLDILSKPRSIPIGPTYKAGLLDRITIV